MQYASLRGSFDGMDPTVITEIADYYRNEVGYKIPPMTPFVGRDFNVTRAGIHADGLMKDEKIYNVFNTKKILNREPMVLLGQNSGLAGIAYWINKHYGLDEADMIEKSDPLVVSLKEWIDGEYANGRQTSLSVEEVEEEIAKVAGDRFTK